MKTVDKTKIKWFKVLNSLLDQKPSKLPQYTNEKDPDEKVDNLFVEKIRNIRKQLDKETHNNMPNPKPTSPTVLNNFPD